MTFPITPNPGIHNPPTSANSQTGLGSSAQLAALAKQLPMAMTLDLVNSLLDAFGLSEFTAQADGALVALAGAVSDTSSNATTAIAHWEDFFSALGVGDLPGLSTFIGDIQAALNGFSAALQQSWLNFQGLINGIVGDIDSDVAAAVAAWNAAVTDITNIIDSFAPGGTATEFATGVTNLLALFGLTNSTILTTTNLTTFWNAVITDIINPLHALEVDASNIIGDIEIAAINGLASALSALLGTTVFQSLLDAIANSLGHTGAGHTVTNIESYLGLIPAANVTNVLGGANLGADITALEAGLTAYLTTGSFQSLLDAIANSLGHTGAGHTVTNIESYLGLIPAANVTNVLGGANLGADITALEAGLTAYLTTGSFQSLLDAIANSLGHTGAGHTVTNIETYMGLIPPANVISTAGGGASLTNDINAITTNHDTLATAMTGTTTPTSTTPLQVSAVPTGIPIANIDPPPDGTTLGSGFHIARTAGTSNSVGTTNTIFASGFFDTQASYNTSDYSWDGQSLTVTHAGWYHVTLHVLLNTSISGQLFQGLLYVGGSFRKIIGGTLYPFVSSSNWVFGGSTLLFLTAGQVVTPAYWCTLTNSASFKGDSSGQYCYFEVALANRSIF